MTVTPASPCPTCRKRGRWLDTPSAPFCSPRCKLVDLGRWLGEEHRVSVPLRPSDFDGYDHLPSGPELDVPTHEPPAQPKLPFRSDSVG